MFQFNHFNFNVLDLNRSLTFYQEALGLHPVRTVDTDDFSLVFLGDGSGTAFCRRLAPQPPISRVPSAFTLSPTWRNTMDKALLRT